MKLSEQLYRLFFCPFLSGITLSFITIIIFTILFTNNYIDKITGENIVEIENKNSEINLKSINNLINTALLKVQGSLNEIIIAYTNTAKKVKKDDNIKIEFNKTYFKSIVDLTPSFYEENEGKMDKIAYWIYDKVTNEDNLIPNSTLQKQLYSYSHVVPHLYTTYTSTQQSSFSYYLAFDGTDLFISFPLSYDYETEYVEVLYNYDHYIWCVDPNGEIYTVYKAKCRDYYVNIQKAKTSIFDNNINDFKNRTIFVTEFYQDLGQSKSANIYTMYVQFEDPISNQNAYACADIGQDNLVNNFESMSPKISGYFIISLVGFNRVFYFPHKIEEALTITENIYGSDQKFFIEEKTDFLNRVQNMMTSNYIKNIEMGNNNLWEEVFVNGQNKSEQYFYFQGEKYYFSIFPVTLENLQGKKEHVLSIIYVYNHRVLYERITTNSGNIYLKILIIVIIFLLFGLGLLYLVLLSFETLSKYIVISIKNVNYMLKGINIGGNNRLEYLDFLNKRQEENVENLENMMNSNENDGNNITKEDNSNFNLNSLDNNYQENNKGELNDEENKLINKSTTIDIKNEIFNQKNNINIINFENKFQEETEYIDKEMSFYNYDQNLLLNRPSDIDNLITSMIDLKQALALSSTEQKKEKIINYSNSGKIFDNCRNNEAMDICQSNIGNLEIQLHKYDKAIYHLVISLQDIKLKKFLGKALSDELDEGDILLNKLSILFDQYIGAEQKKINKLTLKQEDNMKNRFSQKIIGTLINFRYNRLIYSYYKFFSLIQKYNGKGIHGQFMNTSFHTINYYNKIIIQYIYLCYMKNDLIKIGESILDYIEFLIKFKFKTSKDNQNILNIHNSDNNHYEIKEKKKYKKKIFDKLVKWFCLFDEYVSYVKNYTSLGDENKVFEDISHENISDIELSFSNKSAFLFKAIVQRGEFLKGKFALLCKDYVDALFYFIRVVKKETIVRDGLIKKKALKRIFIIINILSKLFVKYKINKKIMEKELIASKMNNNLKRSSKIISKNINIKNNNTFEKELAIIMNCLKENFIKNNNHEQKNRDIIIIIDFNIYNLNDDNDEQEKNNEDILKINSYVDKVNTILTEYLSDNDKVGVFLYTDQHQIICPLMNKKEIDIESFYKDLIYYKNRTFNVEESEDTYTDDDLIDEMDIDGINNIKNYSSDNSQEYSLDEDERKKSKNNINIINRINGLFNSINYTQVYLKIKQSQNDEKYIILFTDLFNVYPITDENIKNNFERLNENKEIIFLLLRKKDNNEKFEEKKLNSIISRKFSTKSKIISLENIKKILSNNNVIKEECIFPNEIYKY